MPSISLTQKFIDSARCPSGKSKIDYFDTQLKGFVFKVLSSGRRSFYLRYQEGHGQTKEKCFANASVMSLAEARATAKKLLSRLSLGEDPFAEKAERKKIPTYKQFIQEAYLPYIKANKPSWRVDEAQLRLHILPVLGDLYMDEITKQHAIDLFTQHRESGNFAPASTNRMLNVASRTFSCAMQWEVKGLSSNPMAAVQKLKENNERDRCLSDDELERLLSALESSEHPRIKAIVRMLLYTGARRNEVLEARWSDIDFENSFWKIEFNKSGKTRYVPLSDGAKALLRGIKRVPDVEHIFFNPETMLPYVNIFHAWNRVRKIAGIEDVCMHDLRHSCASFLVNEGRTIYEVQRILGHSNVKTTQRYAHLSPDTLLAATNVVSNILDKASSRVIAAEAKIVEVEPYLEMGVDGDLVIKHTRKENECQKPTLPRFTPEPSIGSSGLSIEGSKRRIGWPITGDSSNPIFARLPSTNVAPLSLN